MSRIDNVHQHLCEAKAIATYTIPSKDDASDITFALKDEGFSVPRDFEIKGRMLYIYSPKMIGPSFIKNLVKIAGLQQADNNPTTSNTPVVGWKYMESEDEAVGLAKGGTIDVGDIPSPMPKGLTMDDYTNFEGILVGGGNASSFKWVKDGIYTATKDLDAAYIARLEKECKRLKVSFTVKQP